MWLNIWGRGFQRTVRVRLCADEDWRGQQIWPNRCGVITVLRNSIKLRISLCHCHRAQPTQANTPYHEQFRARDGMLFGTILIENKVGAHKQMTSRIKAISSVGGVHHHCHIKQIDFARSVRFFFSFGQSDIWHWSHCYKPKNSPLLARPYCTSNGLRSVQTALLFLLHSYDCLCTKHFSWRASLEPPPIKKLFYNLCVQALHFS